MDTRQLLDQIRESVGEHQYSIWERQAEATYNHGMRAAKHAGLNGKAGQSVSREAHRSSFLQVRYVEWLSQRSTPAEPQLPTSDSPRETLYQGNLVDITRSQ